MKHRKSLKEPKAIDELNIEKHRKDGSRTIQAQPGIWKFSI